MALGDVGMFNPAESNYMTPGAYGETLKADALKRANYLAMMDQFYEQLDETKREFDKTLGFKESALAQEKWIAEENIGLGKSELALKGKLGMADIALRERALATETSYKGEALSLAKGNQALQRGLLERYLTKETKASPAEEYFRYLTQGSKTKVGSAEGSMTSGEVSGYARPDWLTPENFPEAKWGGDSLGSFSNADLGSNLNSYDWEGSYIP